MRARHIIAAGLAVIAAAVCAVPALGRPARSPARLLVAADEWSLLLSRPSLGSGQAIIQFQNRGEDPHDLRIRPIGSGASRGHVGISETSPRQLKDLRVRLAPGRYRLWCSLPGHRAKGMRAVLRVRRR